MKILKSFLIILMMFMLFSSNLHANKLLTATLEKTTAPIIEKLAVYDGSLAVIMEKYLRLQVVYPVVTSAAIGRENGFMISDESIGKLSAKIVGLAEFAKSVKIGDGISFEDGEIGLEELIMQVQAALDTILNALIIDDSNPKLSANILPRNYEEVLPAALISILYPLIESANWIITNTDNSLARKSQMISSMMILIDNATDPSSFVGNRVHFGSGGAFEEFIGNTAYYELDSSQLIAVANYLLRRAVEEKAVILGSPSGLTYDTIINNLGENLLTNLFKIFNDYRGGGTSINMFAFTAGVRSVLNVLRRIGYINDEQYFDGIKNPFKWIKDHAPDMDISLLNSGKKKF